MGEARHHELLDVGTILDLADLRVLNLPDGKLQELDPSTIEKPIRDELLRVQPQVVVTFPIHGISGFPDHIVTHFAVTRVYLELQKPGTFVVTASRVLHRCFRSGRIPMARERHRTSGDRLCLSGDRLRHGTISRGTRLLCNVCGCNRTDEGSSGVRQDSPFRIISRRPQATLGGSL